MNVWYKAEVLRGSKLGRTFGFPTVNLNTETLPKNQKEGIFASKVKYKDKTYKGALFYEPRIILGETEKVLEIYILDFNKEIYGETIEFCVKDFIRDVKNFSSTEEFKTQLKKDTKKVKLVFSRRE